MTTQAAVRVGMRVVAADGKDVGTVKAVRDRDFLISLLVVEQVTILV